MVAAAFGLCIGLSQAQAETQSVIDPTLAPVPPKALDPEVKNRQEEEQRKLKAAKEVAERRAKEAEARALAAENEAEKLHAAERVRQATKEAAAKEATAKAAQAAQAAARPGTEFRDCDTCPEMVVIPAGSFMMGSPASEEGRSDSEGPQHAVTISQPFAAGRYEVTFDEWDTCVREGGCGHQPHDQGWGRGRRPVINVSWNDAQQYMNWLSKKSGKNYRLLTEAEWEYATRAGTTSRYYWGDSDTDICRYASVDKGGDGCGTNRTSSVGSRQPNAFSLYDMLGNVWEWVEDCWNANYNGAPRDGSAWTAGDCGRRVLRGGSWGSYPQLARSADRDGFDPSFRGNYDGFRVARTL